MMDTLTRFLSKIRFTGCWEWTGSLDTKGYGHWYLSGKTLAAHRWAYEHWIGPIPTALEVDHLCRNSRCVRPDHLEAVTHKENMRRGIKGILTAQCPHGHEYSYENTHIYNGHRFCRACNCEAQRRRRARRLM